MKRVKTIDMNSINLSTNIGYTINKKDVEKNNGNFVRVFYKNGLELKAKKLKWAKRMDYSIINYGDIVVDRKEFKAFFVIDYLFSRYSQNKKFSKKYKVVNVVEGYIPRIEMSCFSKNGKKHIVSKDFIIIKLDTSKININYFVFVLNKKLSKLKEKRGYFLTRKKLDDILIPVPYSKGIQNKIFKVLIQNKKEDFKKTKINELLIKDKNFMKNKILKSRKDQSLCLYCKNFDLLLGFIDGNRKDELDLSRLLENKKQKENCAFFKDYRYIPSEEYSAYCFSNCDDIKDISKCFVFRDMIFSNLI